MMQVAGMLVFHYVIIIGIKLNYTCCDIMSYPPDGQGGITNEVISTP